MLSMVGSVASTPSSPDLACVVSAELGRESVVGCFRSLRSVLKVAHELKWMTRLGGLAIMAEYD